MRKTSGTISVEMVCETSCQYLATAKLRQLARAVCRRFRIVRATVHLSLVDDKMIRALHKKFFRCAKTTDVISFDLSDPLEKSRYFDIIVNVDQARRQARRRRLSVQAETSLYLVHGLLHQLGFDDLTLVEARRMHKQEDDILREAGFGNVYYSDTKD